MSALGSLGLTIAVEILLAAGAALCGLMQSRRAGPIAMRRGQIDGFSRHEGIEVVIDIKTQPERRAPERYGWERGAL